MTPVAQCRQFSTGAVLTVTTGRFLIEDIDELYALLNFMTDDNLFTHQLTRAVGECAPALLEQHPQLADIAVPDGLSGQEPVKKWLDDVLEALGREVPVCPLPDGAHENRDPLSELIDMRGGAPVSVVVVGD